MPIKSGMWFFTVAAVGVLCADGSEVIPFPRNPQTLSLAPDQNVAGTHPGFQGRFAIGPHATVALIDEAAESVLILDSAGTTKRKIHLGVGDLPESLAIDGFAFLPNGTLVFWLPAERRVITLDSTGKIGGRGIPFGGGYEMMGLTDDARVYAVKRHDPSGPQQHPMEIVVLDVAHPNLPPEAISLPVAGDWPPRITGTIEGLTIVTTLPLFPLPKAAVGKDGTLVWTDASVFAIGMQRTGARDTVVLSRSTTPVPVSEDERGQIQAKLTTTKQATDPAWSWNGPPLPDHHPAIESLYLDPESRLWVIVPASSVPRWQSRQRFEVYTAQGALLGTVDVPPEGVVGTMAVQDGHLWLLKRVNSAARIELWRYRISE